MTYETIAAMKNGKNADIFCWFCDEPRWDVFGVAWVGGLCYKNGQNSNLNARMPTYVETAQVGLENIEKRSSYESKNDRTFDIMSRFKCSL